MDFVVKSNTILFSEHFLFFGVLLHAVIIRCAARRARPGNGGPAPALGYTGCMSENPKRRWFWHKPGGLLVVVTLGSVALLLALWLAFSTSQYRRERALHDHMERESKIRP